MAREGSQGVRVWNTQTRETWSARRIGEVATEPAPALSRDGRRLLLGAGYGFVHVVDVDDLTSRALPVARVWAGEFPGGWNKVTSVAASPDGEAFVTVVNEARLVIWDADTYARRRVIDHGWSHDGALGAYLPGRDRIVTADWGDTALHFWSATTGRLVASTELQLQVDQVAVSPDESMLAVVTQERAHALDAADGRYLYEVVGLNPWITSVAFSPSGRYLAAGGAPVTIHDARSGDILTWVDADYSDQIVFSRDESSMATIRNTQRAEGPRVWDTATGRLVRQLDGVGRVVATAGGFLHARGTALPARERWIEVYDVTNRTRVTLVRPPLPTGPGAFLWGVRFHPGGGLLGVRDRPPGRAETTRFHDARTGELLAVSQLTPWQFTDDGEHVLARTPEGETGLYRLADILRSDAPVSVDPRGMALTAWGALRRTELLPNYPNPFNPETWIPFRLAESADVTVRIYRVDGALVRTLALGSLPAGSYLERDRAARWDGRNDAGEPAPSGVYPYEFSAGDVFDVGRMVILK